MKGLYALLLAIVVLAFPGKAAVITEDDCSRALNELDRALRMSETYQQARQSYIDSLVALAGAEPDPALVLEIADAYTSFNADSAMVWLQRYQCPHDDELWPAFAWRGATLLPLLGYTEDSKRMFESIPRRRVPPGMMAQYLEAGRQMYSYIAAFYQSSPRLSERYTDSMRLYQQRLLEVLDPESLEYRFNQAEYYFMTDRPALAKVLFEELLEELPRSSNLRARAAHHLSSIANLQNDRNAYIYYLAMAARADVEDATREMIALQELGAQLSDEQLTRSYFYMTRALQNAVDGGAALRALDTSQALPVIERAHNESVASWRRTVYTIMGVMALLLIGLIVTLLVLRYEMVKMRRLQMSLRQANHAKEIYISQFLQLCSVYMNKLNHFSKIVTRKIAAGQADELYRMTRSGKFVEEQSREFYDIFDNAFLHIYPNFVADVNALLRPDSRIELKEGELLNTDLRILAFMRLGIEESARIAQVLNYSLNTIYAYRNRLKARAINRDTFEADIACIESLG